MSDKPKTVTTPPITEGGRRVVGRSAAKPEPKPTPKPAKEKKEERRK